MMALALSGGKDSMACLFLMREQLTCAIYVDTGYAYPETREMINLAAGMVPVHVVQSDRAGQNAQHGIPADVVPIDWTMLGQAITGPKPIMIQSYLQCCWENISAPLYTKAHALGVTHLVNGQRNAETYKSVSRDGDQAHGVTRVQPIEHWTDSQVIEFLERHMTVPDHFRTIRHSSLDCYDCTAYERDSQDRIAWTRESHPDAYQQYTVKRQAVDAALTDALKGCAA